MFSLIPALLNIGGNQEKISDMLFHFFFGILTGDTRLATLFDQKAHTVI